MFFALILINSRERLVLPQKWVQLGREMKSGIKKGSATCTVFYSKNADDVPDFKSARIRAEFDPNTKPYYLANIFYIFGMYLQLK